MDMQGSRSLSATQQQAWDALNNPEVLKACIAGCEKFEATGDNQYTSTVAVKIGPVSARFTAKLTLADVNPPNSYRIQFDGQGGAAGFGKGQANVQLAARADGAPGCELSYQVHASVGGKIAQVGQRLIDGVAKSLAEDFFKRFDAELQRLFPAAQAPAVPAPTEQPAPGAAGVPAWVWWVGGAVVVVALWWFTRK